MFNSNTYIEEESVDEMLREPVQLYDVKNVINYNNRIYVSNYNENLNEDLTGNSKNVMLILKLKTCLIIANQLLLLNS